MILNEHEKCIVDHLAAAISERLWEIKDSDAAKALKLPNGRGDQASIVALVAMTMPRKDDYEDTPQ